MRNDLRFAFRALLRDRAFSLTAVLVLTLGIGANTAVFSLVNSVLLKPLAYQEPERLVLVREVVPQLTHLSSNLPANLRHYAEWKTLGSFREIALVDKAEFNLTGNGEPVRVPSARVTQNFFALLGINAYRGRTFLREDGTAGSERRVVISHRLWRDRFGSNSVITNTTIQLNGQPYEVIGVLPEQFEIPSLRERGSILSDQTDIFQPWDVKGNETDWSGDFNYLAIARLQPNVGISQAEAELNAIQSRIAAEHLKGVMKIDLRGVLLPLQERVVERVRSEMLLLWGAVFAVLLIACVNLGNLMLVRAAGRAREAAIRAALGASRSQIVRGVLIESGMVALAGGILGIFLANFLVNIFRIAAPVDIPRLNEVSIDWTVMAFSFILSGAAGIMCGALPALRLTAEDPQESMRASSRSTTESKGKARVREALVSLEVAMCVALLIVAGLLITSFWKLINVPRGFERQNVLTAELSLTGERYKESKAKRQFLDNLVSTVEQQAGVTAAGVISMLPLAGDRWTDIFSLPGDTRPFLERPIASYRPVSPNYFRAMGIELKAGRTIHPGDEPRKVALVSEASARRMWPGENPIGKRFTRSRPDQFEVIGVVADTRSISLTQDPGLMVYVAMWERVPQPASIAIRTTQDPRAAVGMLREIVRGLDPELPLAKVQTMTQLDNASVAPRRFQMQLIAAFACVAMILAAIGVYGVLAHTVTRRRNEIGVRLALGATPAGVTRLIVTQGLRPVVLGLAGGIVLALALGRVIAGLLFQVPPSHPWTIAVVSVLMLVTAVAACWIPARRAGRLDPLVALRVE